MAKILDGNILSKAIKNEIKAEIERDNLKVGLAVILVGDDPASHIYVNYKQKDCAECGIESSKYILSESAGTDELLSLIDTLNEDSGVNGILIQQPLPKQIDLTAANERINPLKDVDAFRADNVGRITIGDYTLGSCTPAGVMEMLRREEIPVSGKECVVVGRSNIVGKPMAMMLLHEHGTVTICHSRTANLKEVCKRADILVAAIGKANFISAEYVKKGAVVIDVGINRNEDNKLCGDVDFAAVEPLAGYITPVPGGVGPMTRAMLMKNTLTAMKLQSELNKA
ncbi:MAG: bifunctional methylenetetrahydrofolate dehydrogenase/methenyltetrahydrofolate cyclohydrolase FolD [Oscillospiraceae bacterium]|jgi:methylenetetrahydrofolate dehydrogenase (NADP+)/methenyltetrahydrofolate cyclohydrolase|nr:bifunctional methylenetetrahydrofolate dehydrogenase/methenyltetrahydrofolate cyclohydrolase FolD [Oscillospiraceae bacterium]